MLQVVLLSQLFAQVFVFIIKGAEPSWLTDEPCSWLGRHLCGWWYRPIPPDQCCLNSHPEWRHENKMAALVSDGFLYSGRKWSAAAIFVHVDFLKSRCERLLFLVCGTISAISHNAVQAQQQQQPHRQWWRTTTRKGVSRIGSTLAPVTVVTWDTAQQQTTVNKQTVSMATLQRLDRESVSWL